MDDTTLHPMQKLGAHLLSDLPHIDPEFAARFLIESPTSGYATLGAFKTIKPLDVRACEAHKARLQGPTYVETRDYQAAISPNPVGNYAKIRPGYTPAPPPPPPKKSIHHEPFPAYDPLEEEEETDDVQDYITPLPDPDPDLDDEESLPATGLVRNLQKLPKLTDGRYITMPFEVVFDQNLRAGDIVCYLAIASHAKPGQPVTMSTSRIVQLTGHSPRFVREATNRLRQFGHLRTALIPFGTSSGRITQYTLTSPVFALRAHKKGN